MSTFEVSKRDVYRYNSYAETPEDLSTLRYGDLESLDKYQKIEPTDFYMHRYMTGSDYCGSLVEVSNFHVFLEQFRECKGVHEVYGGHGTFAVAVRVDCITDEMREFFSGLDNYPLADEDDHSHRELDAQNDAWDSWAAHDFRKALAVRFPDMEDEIFDIPADGLSRIFYDAAETSNTYWENEQGSGMYIDIDRIAAVVTSEQIKETR